MHRTLTIAQREFVGYFNSPAAYIVICLFLILIGVFFWNPFFLINRATVRGMFDLMSVLLLPTAPAMTMGLLAEEKRTGTLELLLTMPLKDSEVIIGKYLGALGLLACCSLLHAAVSDQRGDARPARLGPGDRAATSRVLLQGARDARDRRARLELDREPADRVLHRGDHLLRALDRQPLPAVRAAGVASIARVALVRLPLRKHAARRDRHRATSSTSSR